MRTPRNPHDEQCHICGCTHWRPCYDGCGWATAAHTLCTRCVERIVDCAVLLLLGTRLALAEQQTLLEEIAR
jgi:hypothetical protein